MLALAQGLLPGTKGNTVNLIPVYKNIDRPVGYYFFGQRLHQPVMECCECCENNFNELKMNGHEVPAEAVTAYSCCLVCRHFCATEHCGSCQDKTLELMAAHSDS